MKSVKTRLFTYAGLAVLVVIQHIALMMTGYDASKQRGYFPSEDRDAMPLLDALTAQPMLLAYQLGFLLAIVLLVEAMIFLFKKK